MSLLEAKEKEADAEPETEDNAPSLNKVAKKVAKAVVDELPPVTPVVEVVVREMAGPKTDVDRESGGVGSHCQGRR